MCLKSSYDEGRLNPDEPGGCANAMRRGNCNAYKMREEEIAAGKSLYFTDAIVIEAANSTVDKGSEGYQRGWAQVGASLGKGDKMPQSTYKRVEIQSRPVERKDDGMFNTGAIDMASVISNEVKKEKLKLEIDEKITAMKKEIARLAKTDIKAAKELLVKAKKLKLLIN